MKLKRLLWTMVVVSACRDSQAVGEKGALRFQFGLFGCNFKDAGGAMLAAGGRFYFAKDLTATPDALRRAYPNLPRFLALKRELDPHGILTSDLAVRLGLMGAATNP